MNVIAIPGYGFYAILLDADGVQPPRLIKVSSGIVEQARAEYQIVRARTVVAHDDGLGDEWLKPRCPIVLGEEGDPVKVHWDADLPPATGGAFRALQHLVRIFPSGEKREALSAAAGVKDVSGALGDLVRRDPRWSRVLLFPRSHGELKGPGGVYCLVPHRPLALDANEADATRTASEQGAA